MHALILADGDAPDAATSSTPPGRAGTTAVGLVVAADGGARHAATARRRHRPLGRRRRLASTRRVLGALAARGVPIERSRPDKDESDTELAVAGGAPAAAPTAWSSSARSAAPRIDHGLANVGLLALPALAGRPAVLVDARSRISLVRRPDPDGGTGRADAHRPAPATSSRCCPPGRASAGSPRAASPIRCATSRCRPGRPAACRTSGRAGSATRRPSGAASCWSWSPLLGSDA